MFITHRKNPIRFQCFPCQWQDKNYRYTTPFQCVRVCVRVCTWMRWYQTLDSCIWMSCLLLCLSHCVLRPTEDSLASHTPHTNVSVRFSSVCAVEQSYTLSAFIVYVHMSMLSQSNNKSSMWLLNTNTLATPVLVKIINKMHQSTHAYTHTYTHQQPSSTHIFSFEKWRRNVNTDFLSLT